MIAAIRLFIIAFVILTAVYIYLSIRQRWRTRRALEDEFDQGGIDGDKDTFVEEGLKDYQESLRRKLILGVYIVPLIIVTVMIYVTNFM